MSAESGRADQSARWNRLSSRTPRYFSSSAARPIPGSFSSWAATRVSNRRIGVETVLPVEQPEVVVGVVEHDLDGRIGQQLRRAAPASPPPAGPPPPSPGARRAGAGRSGPGSGESSPPRCPPRAAAPAEAARAGRPGRPRSGSAAPRSLRLAHQLEAGRDLVERLGERLVELGVGLRACRPWRRPSGACARGARRGGCSRWLASWRRRVEVVEGLTEGRML